MKYEINDITKEDETHTRVTFLVTSENTNVALAKNSILKTKKGSKNKTHDELIEEAYADIKDAAEKEMKEIEDEHGFMSNLIVDLPVDDDVPRGKIWNPDSKKLEEKSE
tara:strand:- start:43 stop:369 length:327 start_codon:yes stop_codon:yes gene_type:complete